MSWVLLQSLLSIIVILAFDVLLCEQHLKNKVNYSGLSFCTRRPTLAFAEFRLGTHCLLGSFFFFCCEEGLQKCKETP